MLGWVRRWSVGRPEWLRKKPDGAYSFPSRVDLVERFHDLREADLPPVMVIKGMRGTGKTELLTRMQVTYQERRGWQWAEEVDARLALGGAIAPEPLGVFTRLSIELDHGSSHFRPASTPRFGRLREEFLKEFTYQRVDDAPPALRAVLKAGDLGASYAAHAAHHTPPVVKPSQAAPLFVPLRLVWRRFASTKAQQWCRAFLQDLPTSSIPASVAASRLELYTQGFGLALAADLKAASERRVLKLGKVVVFFDAYDRVERESTRTHFLIDFAVEARRLKTPLMLVVGCREEKLWTRLLERTGAVDSYADDFRVSDAVEIHTLQPIDPSAALHYLHRLGVPGDIAVRLVNLSGGLPMGLALLADAFARDRPGPLFAWQRQLLDDLPAAPPRPTDDWAHSFAAVIGAALLHEADPELRAHIHAASTCRNFNSVLLGALLGDSFSDVAYANLVASSWIEPKRNSVVLGDHSANRLRSYARRLLADDPSHESSYLRWHKRAQNFLIGLQAGLDDATRVYAIDVEVLFHEFSSDPQRALAAFGAAFTEALNEQRVDRCQLLLEAATDAGADAHDWGVEIARIAGTLLLQYGEYDLALIRLEDAMNRARGGQELRTVTLLLDQLVTCCRLKGDHARAWHYLRDLEASADDDMIIDFALAWRQSLLAKARGDLLAAEGSNEYAFRCLEALRHAPPAEVTTRDVAYGRDALARKVGHLERNRADIALRMGDFRTASTAIETARSIYGKYPEAAAEVYLTLLEAHMLRQEGNAEGAVAIAKAAVERFASASTSTDRRNTLMATRALGQASLALAPSSAVEHFETLVDAERNNYPLGEVVGHWGLGEVARHNGDIRDARRHYERALASAPHDWVVELLYVRLSIAELNRLEGQSVAPAARALAALDRVEFHPALAVAAALIELRASTDQRAATGAFERANHHVGRFVARHNNTVHHTMVDAHSRAMAAGELWPPIAFAFP